MDTACKIYRNGKINNILLIKKLFFCKTNKNIYNIDQEIYLVEGKS